MLTQQTSDDFDIVGYFAAEFEYAPYLVLAALTLLALFLALRTRKADAVRASVKDDELAATDEVTEGEQLAGAVPPTLRKTRYVDIAAKSVLAPRVAANVKVIDEAPLAPTAEAPDSSPRRERARDDEGPFDKAAFGVLFLMGAFVLLLLIGGWQFPGLQAVMDFTTAGWWTVGILVALTLPVVVRKVRREKGAERYLTGASWLVASTAIVAVAVSFLGLGLASAPFRIFWEETAQSKPITVKTETIVPSSVTFKSGGLGIFVRGGEPTMSGLVETDDGVRTFSTTSYGYGDEWQLITEKSCTTTTYTSPLVIQNVVDEEQCFTSTTAVLGDEIPTN